MISRRRFLHATFWAPPALLLATACSGARPGVTAALDADAPPPLGGTMTFRLTATCAWDAPNPNSNGVKTNDAEVSFVMTAGIVPIQLDPVWQATTTTKGMTAYTRKVVFKAHVPLLFEFSTQLQQVGEQHVIGSVVLSLQTSKQGDSQTLFLQVSSNGTRTQRTPFTSSP